MVGVSKTNGKPDWAAEHGPKGIVRFSSSVTNIIQETEGAGNPMNGSFRLERRQSAISSYY